MLQLQARHNVEAEQLKQAFCQIMSYIAKQVPNPVTLKTVNQWQQRLPHLEETVLHLIATVHDGNLVWLFRGISNIYEDQGLYKPAQLWLQNGLQIVENRLGSKHIDTATSLNNLANIYDKTGHRSDAENLYKRALQIYETCLFKNHPLIATGLNNLGACYTGKGCYEKAKSLIVRSLQIRGATLGSNHPDTANSLSRLAILYMCMGCYNDAEPLFIRSLQIQETTLGYNHPNRAFPSLLRYSNNNE